MIQPGGPDPDPPEESESTTILLALTRKGDRGAREKLVARYLPRLHRVAPGRVPPSLRSLNDTADLVQITMVRALEKVSTFEKRHDGAFLGYLRMILLNRIRDEVRRATTHQAAIQIEDLAPAAGQTPLEAAIGAESLEIYERALAQLPPAHADAVVMRIELECTYPEIAEAMGMASANAARMMIARALVRLAEFIGGQARAS